MRVGIGVDFHRFAPRRTLMLGGIPIPYELGLAGHSDADVLLHAICDALLGAAALGDIGQHFPDTDLRYKDISSLALLADVHQKITASGFAIENIDATVIAQEPKLAPYIAAMREKIAQTLKLSVSQINIKATTPEGLGALGRREGIAVWAVALLTSQKSA
uniref:2-C-methyl-D-erythritol 2,4-cyclodiphosphate synthase n=2 Tax=Candidatus Bipolaricaulota TaxID=67810 RepID=H5SC60_9BACT|nr:2-C-methyl-D-erythritol 2,4-cyclodiphosphate synthase [uncultured Acetothermia bacterium]BAL59444.1 2-C-methyl-D-erythritol 2,4-cyclodiphosphate synthase [Candidatus Acetothermum autotrophicum]